MFGWKKSSFSTPLKPGFMLRLSTMTRPRLLDVEDRHPVDRALRVLLRGRVHDVVGADDEHDVGLGEVVVDVVEVEELVVRHVGLGQEHVHVPGHAAGDRVNRVAYLAPLASSDCASSRTACCAWETAMP